MIKPFLEAGKIVSVHGLKGEVRVQPFCDSGEFLKKFRKLYFDKKGEKSVKLISVRPHGNVVIMKLEGTDTVEEANLLRGKMLYLKRDDAKLRDGQYFISELIGSKVYDVDNESIFYGKISDVSYTGANDVWHIKSENGKEYLIPAIPPVIIDTDVENETIKIRPLKGIFDGEVNGDED